jgi:hypothetical protein
MTRSRTGFPCRTRRARPSWTGRVYTYDPARHRARKGNLNGLTSTHSYDPLYQLLQVVMAEREGFEFRRSVQLPVKHLLFERVTREFDLRLESLQFP